MQTYKIYTGTHRKEYATRWAKRITKKLGYEVHYWPVRDYNGNIGHGPGSMGWTLEIIVPYSGRYVENKREVEDAIKALDPRYNR